MDEHNSARRARDGDTVLRVNLGHKDLTFDGELHTADHHPRKYTATITLQVSDPKVFAICYRQRTDPVARLRDAIYGQLDRWTQSVPHDSIDSENLRFYAERGARLIGQDVGLELVSHASVYAQLSLRRQESVDIVQGAEVADVANSVRRSQETDEQVHKIWLDAQARLANVTIKELISRYEQLIQDGMTPEEVAQAHPSLVKSLAPYLPPASQGTTNEFWHHRRFPHGMRLMPTGQSCRPHWTIAGREPMRSRICITRRAWASQSKKRRWKLSTGKSSRPTGSTSASRSGSMRWMLTARRLVSFSSATFFSSSTNHRLTRREMSSRYC